MALTQATKEMENKLAECEDAVPALFASIGDTLIDMIEATPAMYLLTKGVQVKDSIKWMVVCVMRLVRGPCPSTVYGYPMEKGTWTASNCICFGSRKWGNISTIHSIINLCILRILMYSVLMKCRYLVGNYCSVRFIVGEIFALHLHPDVNSTLKLLLDWVYGPR